MIFDLYTYLISLFVSFAHFFIGLYKRVLLQRLFFPFLNVVFICNTRRLMSQKNRQRRIWRTCVWIWFKWYDWYWIGWVVAWRRISFRCHDFWWWVMWWWQRVTWSPIKKYQRCQYLFYCTNIGWIIYLSDIFQIIWNGLIWFCVIWINVNQVLIFVIPDTEFLYPKLSTSKNLRAQNFRKVIAYKISLELFNVTWYANPL